MASNMDCVGCLTIEETRVIRKMWSGLVESMDVSYLDIAVERGLVNPDVYEQYNKFDTTQSCNRWMLSNIVIEKDKGLKILQHYSKSPYRGVVVMSLVETMKENGCKVIDDDDEGHDDIEDTFIATRSHQVPINFPGATEDEQAALNQVSDSDESEQDIFADSVTGQSNHEIEVASDDDFADTSLPSATPSPRRHRYLELINENLSHIKDVMFMEMNRGQWDMMVQHLGFIHPELHSSTWDARTLYSKRSLKDKGGFFMHQLRKYWPEQVTMTFMRILVHAFSFTELRSLLCKMERLESSDFYFLPHFFKLPLDEPA